MEPWAVLSDLGGQRKALGRNMERKTDGTRRNREGTNNGHTEMVALRTKHGCSGGVTYRGQLNSGATAGYHCKL